jgi:hypothetical protein
MGAWKYQIYFEYFRALMYYSLYNNPILINFFTVKVSGYDVIR